MPRTRSQSKTAKGVTPKTTTTKSASKSPAIAGKKRQHTSSNGATKEKRPNTRSLTTADIPDVVTAVVQSLPQSRAVTSTLAQTGRCTTGIASSSHRQVTSNCEVSPSSKSGDDSDEDANNEEFGKSNCIQYGNIA